MIKNLFASFSSKGDNSKPDIYDAPAVITTAMKRLFDAGRFEYVHEDRVALANGQAGQRTKPAEKKESMRMSSAAADAAALRFLIQSNIESFKFVGWEAMARKAVARYDGAILRETALEAYKNHLRDALLVPPRTENPTNDELMREITSGRYRALLKGVPGLVFAENPIPISLWIDDDEMAIRRVEVDTKEAKQAMYDTVVMEDDTSACCKIVESSIARYDNIRHV